MKAVIIVAGAGAPMFAAQTALLGALSDGFVSIGVPVHVVGLAEMESRWSADALGQVATSAPWLPLPSPSNADRREAKKLGIAFDEDGGLGWLREVLLQRELDTLAIGHSDMVVLFYPRSQALLRMAASITGRRRWKLIVFATEAPTEKDMALQIVPVYVEEVVSRADGIIAVSEDLAEYWVSRGVSATNVLVIPTPARVPALVRSAGQEAEVPIADAIFAGSLGHGQVDYLLDVADLVRAEIASFHLAIFGAGDENQLDECAKKVSARGLDGVVSVHPPVSPVDVPRLLQRAHVLLVPPRNRGRCETGGFPMKLVECLASGRPVVTTTMGDIAAYLSNRESAYLSEPWNHDEFARLVIEALHKPQEAERVGAAGRAVAERVFAAHRVARLVSDFVAGLPSARRTWASRISGRLR